jgi:hypothetical protein
MPPPPVQTPTQKVPMNSAMNKGGWPQNSTYICVFLNLNICVFLNLNICVFLNLNICVFLNLNICVFLNLNICVFYIFFTFG